MKPVIAYKLARPDGWDFHTGKTINYRGDGHFPHEVKVPNPDASRGICSSGVGHASLNPNDCFVGASIPCSAYRLRFAPVCGDKTKWGWLEAEVLEEIQPPLDALFGWNYTEACAPINPFSLPLRQPTPDDLALLKAWASVGDSVWASVGDSVWASAGASVWDLAGASVWDLVRASVGASVWASVRASVGDSVWASVRDSVGDSVKDSVKDSVGDLVRASVWDLAGDSAGDSVWDLAGDSAGDSVRASVWDLVGAYIGSLFPGIQEWKYVNHTPGTYPFQAAVDLWKRGLVPSWDGKVWRLHSGEKATIVWQGK